MSYPYQIKSADEYFNSYRQSIENPEIFWNEIASHFVWKKKWDKTLEWNFSDPDIKWFKGGRMNVTENCLDRHLKNNANRVAILWEPNDPKELNRKLTYRELYEQVCRFSQVLQYNGVKKGDRVCIYMGMIPELVITMLACARIGAIHSVIFGGFSAKNIAGRVEDAHAEFVVTCDGAFRGSKAIELKQTVDEALEKIPFVKRVIVYQRTHSAINMKKGRDVWWHDEMTKTKPDVSFPAEEMDAEDTLYILYTSGSTGKPKGVVHTCAGYLVWADYTFVNTFQYKPGMIYFCTADIGWVTGHTYTVYGPLSAGATSLMFEGIPTYPGPGRFWEIIGKYKVDILYTAPTAIRSLMTYGNDIPGKYDLSSLKVLGSVGEPINKEAWNWYHEQIGKGKIPIVDTWWQTETGGIMISNLAGITPHKPSWATLPLPGVQPCIVDENGKELDGAASGNLCIKFPWPGMIRTTYGDHERCRLNYFSAYKNLYFSGDGCLRDEEGRYRITGRVDDVLNVSGHRIGTAEVENAINMDEHIVESAVVGYPHDIKGQGIYAFVIYVGSLKDHDLARKEVNDKVTEIIGAIAKPDKIQFVNGLPKTRSGKIMRRILRKIAEGDTSNLGDISTLLDPSVVDEIKAGSL
ncbi:MAG: acetate--CoA ligase [Bacteroidia bacterium]|nr:acetate--CoA ligase [Bacteroidia bacterium]